MSRRDGRYGKPGPGRRQSDMCRRGFAVSVPARPSRPLVMARQPSQTVPWDRSPVRVAHVVSHPIQYFAPLYREISVRPEVDLTVYFLSDVTARNYYDAGFGTHVEWDVDLLGGYSHRILPQARGRALRGGLMQRPQLDIIRQVVLGPYDAVWLHGYNHPTLAAICSFATLIGRPVLLREEQTLLEPRSLLKTLGKETALRLLLVRSHGLYIGQANRDYFRHFGVPDSRLHLMSYCVDNDHLQQRHEALLPLRTELRSRMGITDDAPVILFVGKLIPKKAPLDLLNAYRAVRAQRPCWLVYAGDGPQRSEIEAQVLRHGIEGVRMLGFLNQSELPEAYVAADLHVLPSRYSETWGLVVNEAMNFALPIIVTNHVGCAPDLVRPRYNGDVVQAGDVGALTTALVSLVESSHRRREYGVNSLTLVNTHSIRRAADALVGAARAVRHGPEVGS